jgi:DNA glycosylase AlkZ-like
VPAPDGAEALEAIARRYLGAYAPATREDLGRWWGVSPAQAGRLIAGLGDAVEPVEAWGVTAFMPAGAVDEAAAAAAGVVRLLPAFDPLVVGATRVGAITPVARRDAVYRPQGWLSPVIAVDGEMAGVWRHERRGAAVAVELEPWAPLSAEVRAAAEAEAESLAAFLGGPLALRWS